ncbi:protein kinase yak1, putative, partial [Ichthyophthirius multifiliis]
MVFSIFVMLVNSSISYPYSIKFVKKVFKFNNFWNIHMAAIPLIANWNAVTLGLVFGFYEYFKIILLSVYNNNYDNEQYDYIMRVNDIIYNEQKNIQYVIDNLLGKGTFGQVVKCSIQGQKENYAIKVIKNKPAYFHQAKTEILLLRVLNKQECEQTQEQMIENQRNKIVKLIDFFVFRSHFCLVFEMMDLSLYDFLRNSKFSGFSFNLISFWIKQIAEGMAIIEQQQIIHCDLKPENIMIKKYFFIIQIKTLQIHIINIYISNDIKIIDFGSACPDQNKIYSYIQSRFYRAPEIILGLKYTIAIDMWSLGCILVELFLGLPIFPGNSEYDQMKRIIDILGYPDNELIQQGKFSNKFFVFQEQEKTYRLKTKKEYEENENVQLNQSKNYFQIQCLGDLENYIKNSQNRQYSLE